MNRITNYEEELGSYFIKDNFQRQFNSDWDLINYIGQLEDRLEKQEHFLNNSRWRIK